MSTPYTRAPHGAPGGNESPHAALLIDFDNVTMGMRSDLSKELKSLLDSDVIKGKVSVQRAYADWRRYPQYIVPLSEASVDLIFAPAYGSNKKNATDIRMAIDGMELVFTRPEIGTYILLTGDSDFSSLVLKLKEYGKYVIGVGIQESSSDILVQNCDEYYSYTSLTGLRKTTESDQKTQDPWVLTTQALKKMISRDDVMRSDRLKQVMQEIDSSFDEGSFGFSKFSKFLAEASSRGLVKLRKMDNGQYEVSLPRGGGSSSSGRSSSSSSSSSRGRSSRNGGRGGRRDSGRGRGRGSSQPSSPSSASISSSEDPLQAAYDLLTDVLEYLKGQGREPVRDSDVKRKLLERDRSFDETELGFSKFSKFLEQAVEHGVVALGRTENGNLQVSLPGGGARTGSIHDDGDQGQDAPSDDSGRDDSGRDRSRSGRDRGDSSAATGSEDAGDDDVPAGVERAHLQSQEEEEPAAVEAPDSTSPSLDRRHESVRAETESDEDSDDAGGQTVLEMDPSTMGGGSKRLGPRRGSTRRRGGDEPPPLFEGQVIKSGSRSGGSSTRESAQEETASQQASFGSQSADSSAPAEAAGGGTASQQTGSGSSRDNGSGGGLGSSSDLDVQELGLPTDADSIVRYMANRYRGVGEKTAEALVDRFGTEVFHALQDDPDAVRSAVAGHRADQVLEAWAADYERRVARRAR